VAGASRGASDKIRTMGNIAANGHGAGNVLNQTVTRSRSGAIDFLRVLGVAAVVVGHVYYNPVLVKTLFPWHVPLFFFLTGYLWSSGRTVWAEFGNRFRTIALPYLSWLAIILIAWVCFALATTGSFSRAFVKDTLYGGYFAVRPFSAFWFMTVLFFVTILYRVVERVPITAQLAFAVVGLSSGYMFGERLAMTPLSIGSAWPCLAFVIAGRAFRMWDARMTYRLVIALVLIAVSAVLVASGISAPVNIKVGDYGTPVLSVLVACALSGGSILLARAAFDRLPAWVSRFVTHLALAGFVVVLSHAVVLWIMGTSNAGGIFDLFLTLGLPWLLGWIIVKTPLAPWLAGVAPK
jgi:acyltransferase